MSNNHKLVLGTAQFQKNYGVLNRKQINHNKILNIAKEHKIRFLDTSPLYGKSEKTIGNHKKNLI